MRLQFVAVSATAQKRLWKAMLHDAMLLLVGMSL